MTTWIETTNTKQDGTPATRNIKIPEMSEEIWFTDNCYAEVSSDVADILANNIDAISKVAEPSSPGTYYGDAGENTTVELVVADGAFDNLTVESLDSDLVGTEKAVSRAIGSDHKQSGAIQGPQDRTGSGAQHKRPTNTPTICWTLDDGLDSHYSFRDTWETEGIKPGIAVNTNPVGSDGSMTWDQIRELVYSYEWTPLNHSKGGGTGTRFSELTEDEIQNQVYDSAKAFLDEGVSPFCFVYNGGDAGGDTGKGIVSELYPYGLGTDDAAIGLDGSGNPESQGEDPFDVSRVVADAVPESDIQTYIDRAVSNNTCLILNSHEIIDGTTSDEGSGQTSTGKIQNIAQYARDAGMEWETVETTMRRSMSMAQFSDPRFGRIHGTLDGRMVARPEDMFQVSTDDGSGTFVNRLQVRSGNPTSKIAIRNAVLDMGGSAWFQEPATTSSTADPTSQAPDGFIKHEVNGSVVEVPYYDT